MARSVAVREDFQPAALVSGYAADGSYIDDEEYLHENYHDQRPLHQELQGTTANRSAEPEASSPNRRRAAQQVNILALVGGFSILIVAYFIMFVFSS